MKSSKRALIVVLALLVLMSMQVSMVHAKANTSSRPVTIYLTISDDGEFVRDKDGDVMAHVPVTVSYFDLGELGLEKYYLLQDEDLPYSESNPPVQSPTLLHALIQATGDYYAGRALTEDDVFSDTMYVTGSPKSLFFTRLWGHDGNFMYYVNHEYPLQRSGWGDTADHILIHDGDEVDVAMFTDYSFYNNSAFLYFDQSSVSVKQAEPVELQLLASETSTVNDGKPDGKTGLAMADEGVRVSTDYGKTWESWPEKTDANGNVKLEFAEVGTYWVTNVLDISHYQYRVAPAFCEVRVTKNEALDPENIAAANAVEEMIRALPDKADITSADAEAVSAVRAAYDALTGVQKTIVKEEDLQKLIASETAIATINKTAEEKIAEAEKQMMEAEKKVAEAEQKLTDAQKASADAAAKSEEVLKQIAALQEQLKAAEEKVAKLEKQLKDAQSAVKPDKLPAVTQKALKAGKKKLTVKWKAVSGVTGYQVAWSTSSKFKGQKTRLVKGAGKTSTVLKSLKAKKKYYVRVRAYRKADSKTQYGTWSTAKGKKTL